MLRIAQIERCKGVKVVKRVQVVRDLSGSITFRDHKDLSKLKNFKEFKGV